MDKLQNLPNTARPGAGAGVTAQAAALRVAPLGAGAVDVFPRAHVALGPAEADIGAECPSPLIIPVGSGGTVPRVLRGAFLPHEGGHRKDRIDRGRADRVRAAGVIYYALQLSSVGQAPVAETAVVGLVERSRTGGSPESVKLTVRFEVPWAAELGLTVVIVPVCAKRDVAMAMNSAADAIIDLCRRKIPAASLNIFCSLYSPTAHTSVRNRSLL